MYSSTSSITSPASTVSGWGSVAGNNNTNVGTQRQMAAMSGSPSSAGIATDGTGVAPSGAEEITGSVGAGQGQEKGSSAGGGSTFADARERERVIAALQNSQNVSSLLIALPVQHVYLLCSEFFVVLFVGCVETVVKSGSFLRVLWSVYCLFGVDLRQRPAVAGAMFALLGQALHRYSTNKIGTLSPGVVFCHLMTHAFTVPSVDTCLSHKSNSLLSIVQQELKPCSLCPAQSASPVAVSYVSEWRFLSQQFPCRLLDRIYRRHRM